MIDRIQIFFAQIVEMFYVFGHLPTVADFDLRDLMDEKEKDELFIIKSMVCRYTFTAFITFFIIINICTSTFKIGESQLRQPTQTKLLTNGVEGSGGPKFLNCRGLY